MNSKEEFDYFAEQLPDNAVKPNFPQN